MVGAKMILWPVDSSLVHGTRCERSPGRAGAGLDYAGDGNLHCGADIVEGQGGCGVAGDDEVVGAVGLEEASTLYA